MQMFYRKLATFFHLICIFEKKIVPLHTDLKFIKMRKLLVLALAVLVWSGCTKPKPTEEQAIRLIPR
jgi:hypothetical protein